jgi:dTDP-4-amino-4,6-dideoxygalactose transaminase
LLLNQLERLPQQLATRMERAAHLREKLSRIDGLSPTPSILDERVTVHGYHLFSMRFDSASWRGIGRDRVVAALQAEGLPVTTGYPQPIYRNELFQSHANVVHPCPEAESYCETSIWLPHNALLADEGWIDEVITAIEKVQNSTSELSAG